jgi:hypothetical protein
MTRHALPDTVEECHQLIVRLREENAQLRKAASVFGQLAERLNHELRTERSLYAISGSPDGHEPQKWTQSR